MPLGLKLGPLGSRPLGIGHLGAYPADEGPWARAFSRDAFLGRGGWFPNGPVEALPLPPSDVVTC